MLQSLLDYLDQSKDRVIELQREMTARPAIGPENGGQGEAEKAAYLFQCLKNIGVKDIQVFNSPDPRVASGQRPNIAAKIKRSDFSGAAAKDERRKTLWVIGHMDVVPAGELSLWGADPFTLRVDGDNIIGRGVEDNQQAITSALLAAEALAKGYVSGGCVSAGEAHNGNKNDKDDKACLPSMDLGLLLVADEESGNRHGMQFLLEKHPDIFSPDDLMLVPDYGENGGGAIEVAEKAQLWLKVVVSGKQCHASTPENGVNSLRAAAACILAVDEMYRRFPRKNDLFAPRFSTFAPTKKDLNVANINTIPGQDVFYIDCRIIPGIEIDAVLSEMNRILSEAAQKHGATMKIEVIQSAPQTPAASADSDFVRGLSAAIQDVYDVKARPIGIGGGTVAGLLRAAGHEALVWSNILPNPHTPDERGRISCNIGDAKVIARLLFSPGGSS